MTEPPSTSELDRVIRQLREDWRDDIAQLRGELRDRDATFTAALAKLATEDSLAAERRRWEDRYVALEQKLSNEKADRIEGDKDQQRQLDRFKTWLLTGVVPVVVSIVMFILNYVRRPG
ncbi:MAG: hypothetical protein QM638_01295 [Nocardioides sp.]|uniref:hypothetical protein n=1 Tax=Nocardioides sp. TaxID=35761 RepID=UPI0039E295DA